MTLKEFVNIIKTRKIFEPVLFFINLILFFSDIIVFKAKVKTTQKKILIIKTNVIGDYFFFRNFFEIIKKDKKYQDYQIDVIGNILWKPIFEKYDSKFIDNVYWLDIYKFSTNIFYRRNIIKNLPSFEYDIILNPVISRIFVVDDLLVRKLNSKNKIGLNPFLHNIKKWEVWFGNKFYSKLIDVGGVYFDFYISKIFIRNSLQINTDNFLMSLTETTILKKDEKFIILVPGAGDKRRQWNPDNFAKVANYILTNSNLIIKISGSLSEKHIGDSIIHSIKEKGRIQNLAGNLPLTDLIILIKNSEFILTNDSSSVPIAVSLNKRCICVSNGKNFARFNPYPSEYSNAITTLYPPSMRSMLKTDFEKLVQINMYDSQFDINETTSDEVISLISSITASSNKRVD